MIISLRCLVELDLGSFHPLRGQASRLCVGRRSLGVSVVSDRVIDSGSIKGGVSVVGKLH